MRYQFIGLENEGNTCYMNSVLQMLCSSKDLIKHVIKKGSKTNMYKFFSKYLKTESDKTISPKQYFKKFPFEPFVQHDAHEFLMHTISAFKKVCTVKGNLNNVAFTEKVLSLPIESTLYMSLRTYLEPNGAFTEWPPCLFIHLKRYGELYHSKINIPLEWRVLNKKEKIRKYTIKSFILHVGDSDGENGHYVCLIKNKDKYIICNDEDISEISERKFLRMLKHAYIILYSMSS